MMCYIVDLDMPFGIQPFAMPVVSLDDRFFNFRICSYFVVKRRGGTFAVPGQLFGFAGTRTQLCKTGETS